MFAHAESASDDSFIGALRLYAMQILVEAGLPRNLCEQQANQLIALVREHWGCERPYIPSISIERRHDRIMTALKAGNGARAAAVIAEVSESTARRVARRVRSPGIKS